MRRLLLVVAGVMVLATALSFGVARWTARRMVLPTAARLHDPAWLIHELQLTDIQAGRIEKGEAAFRSQLEALCAAHCAARMGLGDELAKPQPDTAKARAWVERMNAAQAEAERATLAHILQVRALLEPAQARRYSLLIRNQVCNMPMGAP